MDNNELLEEIKNKVHLISKETKRGFNEVWHQLILERFLVKLSNSKHRNNFIFKGGMLLAQYVPLGRETVDLDFLLKSIPGEEEKLKTVLEEIITEKNSQLDFSFKIEKIKFIDHVATSYIGFRVTMLAELASSKTNFSLDAAFGDVVSDQELNITLLKSEASPLFEDNITLLVYPPEYIFSEKFETIISKGPANSRMKDFYDLWILINKGKLHKEKVKESIEKTFTHRNLKISYKINFNDKTIKRMQKDWKNFLQRRIKDQTSDNFNEVINMINRYLTELSR